MQQKCGLGRPLYQSPSSPTADKNNIELVLIFKFQKPFFKGSISSD